MGHGTCPRCGAALARAVLDGLCPGCLAAGSPQATTEDAVAVLQAPDGPGQLSCDEGGVSPERPSDVTPDGPPGLESAAGFWSDRPPLPKIPGYDILREVTHGGQGVVYQAVQRSTRRKVAVKVLLDGPFASRSARRRFEREIELAVSLKHPNVISVFDSGVTEDGHAYYVMDYVRGVPVTRYARDKKLGLEKCLSLLAVACDAVNHAHQKGVIHRDLKPANILADTEGNVRVLDFGLAKALTEPVGSLVSVTGNLVGTLPYMSPEQTRGNPDEIDTRTDVYSLGVVLYEMLTGEHPYPVKGDVAEVIKQICDTPAAPPSKRWCAGGGVPPARPGRCPVGADVDTIVLKALSKERDRRYDTAGELARDVRRFLQDEPIQARRASTLYQFQRFAKRNTPLVAGVAGVIVALVLGIAATGWYAVKADRERDEKERLSVRLVENQESLKQSISDLQVSKALTEKAEQRALDNLGTGMALSGKTLYDGKDYLTSWPIYTAALDAARRYGVPRPTPILTGMLEASQAGIPLIGSFGAEGGVGGFTGRPGMPGHGREVNAVVVCADGRTAIAASEDGRVIRWDLATGALLWTYRAQQPFRGGVNNLVLDVERRRMLAGDDGGFTYLFDVESGELLKTLEAPPPDPDGKAGVWALAFSPDGRRALTAGEERLQSPSKVRAVRLWDLDRPEKVLTAEDSHILGDPDGHAYNVGGVAFLRDGKRAISAAHDGKVIVWDLATLEVLHTFNVQAEVNDIAVVDATYAVSADFKGQVFLLNLDTMKPEPLHTPGPRERVWRVAASPDGSVVAAAGQDGTTRVWDLARRKLLATLYGHTDGVMSVAFSPDGSVVVSGGLDKSVRAWAVPRPLPRTTPTAVAAAPGPPEGGGRVNCVSVSDGPDRLILAGMEGGSVVLWDPAAGKLLRTWHVHDAPVRAVRISADGRRASSVSDDGAVASWDVTGAPSGPHSLESGRIACATFTGGGASVFTLSTAGELKQWRTANGSAVGAASKWNAAGAASLTVSPDDDTALVGFANGTVRKWGLRSGEDVAAPVPSQKSAVAGVALSPDEKAIVTGGEGADAILWDFAAAGWDPRHFTSPRGTVTAVGFSPDGRCVVTGGQGAASLALWDFAAAERYRQFEKDLRPLAGTAPDAAASAAFGRWHAFRGKDDWAVQLLQSSASADPILLARCHWRLGNLPAAREQFTAALARNQGNRWYVELCLRALDEDGGDGRTTP